MGFETFVYTLSVGCVLSPRPRPMTASLPGNGSKPGRRQIWRSGGRCLTDGGGLGTAFWECLPELQVAYTV